MNIEGVLYRARQASVKTTWVYTSQNMQPYPLPTKTQGNCCCPQPCLTRYEKTSYTATMDGSCKTSFVQARQRGPHAIPFCVTGSPSFDEKRTRRQQQCASFKTFRRNRLYKIEELLLHSNPLLFYIVFLNYVLKTLRLP